MQNFKNLYRPFYDKLNIKQKQNLLKETALKFGLECIKFKQFKAFNKSTYSGVFTRDGIKFVFVPGAKIHLGLDLKGKNADEIFNKENLEDMAYTRFDYDDFSQEKLAKKIKDRAFLDEITQFLNKNFTKPQECLIKPMFVEQNYNQSCYEDADINELRHSKTYANFIDDAITTDADEIVFYKKLKIVKENGVLSAKIYKNTSFKELLNSLRLKGYDLASKREWEYLCGGGCESIFAWGDNLNLDMKLKHFCPDKECKNELCKENFFGLKIAYDPYEREISFDGEFCYKGGDGGSAICGGDGIVMGYISTSPYYQNGDKIAFDDKINGDYDFF